MSKTMKHEQANKSQADTSHARRPSTPLISLEKYQQMYAAYLERQSAAHVAKTCGVTESVAARYITKGHPKRGLAPLAERLARVNDMTRQQVDYDLARARAEFQQAARAAFVRVAKRINQMQEQELAADKIPEHLAKLLTVIERTFGEAEHTHEIRGKFAAMSLEDLKRYLDGTLAE